MPAYSDLALQFRRRDIRPGFVTRFHRALEEAGVAFVSGFLEYADLSQEEIAAWNQRKLEENFTLEDTAHFSHDYRQSVYRFGDYSEVRGFWLNQDPEEDEFTYYLILPEAEVLTREDGQFFRPEGEAELLALAQRLWQFPPVGAIQSELELDGPTVGLEALGRGESPILDPFAILGPDYSPKEEGLRVTALARGRPGLLVQEGVPRRHWI